MMKIDRRSGWFADLDHEQEGELRWQPCLETGSGHVPCFRIWFKTKAECEDWMAHIVIGAGWFPGEPTDLPVNPERCDQGHRMKPNPTPEGGRSETVHYWPQDLAEHMEDADE